MMHFPLTEMNLSSSINLHCFQLFSLPAQKQHYGTQKSLKGKGVFDYPSTQLIKKTLTDFWPLADSSDHLCLSFAKTMQDQDISPAGSFTSREINLLFF